MMFKRLLTFALGISLFIPTLVFALVVDIQGKILTPKNEGEACIDITGIYEGFRIEADEIGDTPQICFNNTKQNTIDIHDVNIVAVVPQVTVDLYSSDEEAVNIEEADLPVNGSLDSVDGETANLPGNSGNTGNERTIIVEHTFPPGPNGLITVRKRIFGFFSTPTGLGVASNNTIKFLGYFSQKNVFDEVSEPFEHTVGEDVDSAIFKLEVYAKEKYLIAGERTLKLVIKFTLKEPGQQLTLPLGTSLSLDTGARFEDKLESLVETPDFGEVFGEEVE